jgi:hypothetical protein
MVIFKENNLHTVPELVSINIQLIPINKRVRKS